MTEQIALLTINGDWSKIKDFLEELDNIATQFRGLNIKIDYIDG